MNQLFLHYLKGTQSYEVQGVVLPPVGTKINFSSTNDGTPMTGTVKQLEQTTINGFTVHVG